MFCLAIIGNCAPLKRNLIVEPPSTNEPPTSPNIGVARIVALGDSFSETLPQDPKAQLNWEVVWDKAMLKGSHSQTKMCLNDNYDTCVKVIKYEFKAMQAGEVKIEFRLKEKDDIIDSFTSRVIVQ